MEAGAEAPPLPLAPVDLVIIVVYFVGVLAHGAWVSRRAASDAAGYFLAGRQLPWYLIGFSLFASNMSGSSFVGLMGASYQHGLAVFDYEWTATVVLAFFAFFVLPSFLRSGVYTIPGYLGLRFDARARRAFSAFTVLAILFIDIAGALYAGGLVVVTAVPSLELWQAVAVLAAITGIYTIMGGLEAVVVTDTVQAILLIIGAACIFVFALDAVGGWEGFMAGVEPERLTLLRPLDDPFLPWPGLFGVLLLGFYYWVLNQYVVQRTLGARDLLEGQRGALFAGLLKLPNLFIMVLPGVVAVALYPDLPTPDLVFPKLALELLPVGARGIVMSALIAAIMSSLDSALNGAATLVVMDFIKPRHPQMSDLHLVRWGRVVTGACMVLGAAYSPIIGWFPNLFEYFQSVLSYVTPPIVATALLGIFTRWIARRAGFHAIVFGVASGVPLFFAIEIFHVAERLGLPRPHYTTMAIVMFVAGVGVLVASTLLGPREAGVDLRPITFVPSRDLAALRAPVAAEPTALLRDVRFQALVLVGLVGVTFVAFG